MNHMPTLIPTARQLDYQSWEFGLFLHFGLRTFYEGYVDFDERPMNPAEFNPVNLDCKQWIRTAKEAGMKYAVLTAKHHDGFSNWPSKYSSFSVAASSWKDGKGDVIREFVDACRKYDVKPGLYYSPYDGSADFYNQDAKAYDDYFVNQITELLTAYGEIDILWFDGCGSEGHTYDWARIIGEIRRLQPNILIFNMGDPDFRWVGNEDGIAPVPCWNVVDSTEFSILTEDKEKLGDRLWLPAECDVQLRSNWFYSDSDEHTLKSLEELMGLYYHSVGRGANLLLNIGPDRNGLLPEQDADRLQEFGSDIRRRFDRPFASMEHFTKTGHTWSYECKEPQLLDHVILQEDLVAGEQVRSFKIHIITQKTRRAVTIYEGQHIGHKAIIRVPAIKIRGLLVEITESDREPALRALSLHHVGG
ncbi:alpha-L-fucosidase [Paenibacillus sp. UNCCL117]|uniref:alpha-L-fucosidase n=1 Tax=unclassified Paenibacillus TaxID=185978 RepID=UPI00088A55D8|nr:MULTISPECIES: alpha-L-fucosidase [unclassified Paenibacillus]SDD41705.1 alpha-L-fucosidase [Paenibacillus sp. cl123]SFW47775.1 alpha-L-fucosidase [Paenibacillus sp. UNCCL117]